MAKRKKSKQTEGDIIQRKPDGRRQGWAFFALVALFGLIQFHAPSILTRALISNDDYRLVSPLRTMSWARYWGEWFPNRDNFAFPICDLSLWLDFRVSEALGFPTFWLTNFILVLICLYFFTKIVKLVFRLDLYAVYMLVAFVTLHPLLVEVIQWASMRKWALTGCFLYFGTWKVFEWQARPTPIKPRNLMALFLTWIASLLCFPAGSLWIFWALWFLRLRQKVKGRVLVGAYAAAGIILAISLWAAGQAADYSVHSFPVDVMRTMLFGIMAIGRGTFSLLLPLRLAPYYRVLSILNCIGLVFAIALLLVIGIGLIRAVRHRRGFEESTLAISFLALSLALGLPASWVFLRYPYFAWADHYMFLSVPFLSLGIVLFLLDRSFPVRRKIIGTYVLLVIPLFVFQSWNRVPVWATGPTLMRDCAEQEGSPQCLVQNIEKSIGLGVYDCDNAAAALGIANKAYHEGLHSSENELEIELPYYHAFCAAWTARDRAEGIERLQELHGEYRNQSATAFAQAVLEVRDGNVLDAYHLAIETYTAMPRPHITTVAAIARFRGQIEAFCGLLSDQTDCPERLEAFNKRYSIVLPDEEATKWARTATLMAAKIHGFKHN